MRSVNQWVLEHGSDGDVPFDCLEYFGSATDCLADCLADLGNMMEYVNLLFGVAHLKLLEL